MAPAVVLWAWWRRGGRDSDQRRLAFRCAVAIALSYAVQLVGLAAGLVAAWGYADPLDHLADFAGLVGFIAVAEYAGHAAAAVLGINLLSASRRKPGPISRRLTRWVSAFDSMTVRKV